MANGYVKAAQIIADDQAEVATKLQTLLDTEGVDSGELSNLEITTFGANKFLIAITYAALRSVGLLTKTFGLKISAPTVKFVPKRSLSASTGILSSFIDSYKFFRRLSTSVGLISTFFFKRGTDLSATLGLVTVAPTYTRPFINRALDVSLGLIADFSSVWHDKDQSDSLSGITGLKCSGQALYNGVLPNIPIE